MNDKFDVDYENFEGEHENKSSISTLWSDKNDTEEDELVSSHRDADSNLGAPKKSLKAFLISVIIILSLLVLVYFQTPGDMLHAHPTPRVF